MPKYSKFVNSKSTDCDMNINKCVWLCTLVALRLHCI